MGTSVVRAGFLLAFELVLLSPAGCRGQHPGWRFSSSEVVIPNQIRSRTGLRGPNKAVVAEGPGLLSYSLRFGGKRYVVHMRIKKFLLPRHLPVLVDNEHGASPEEYPYVQSDCYYHGYLEGIPESMAVLNTCQGGLRGTLHLDDLIYEIEPLHNSPRFEHVLSQLVPQEGEVGQSLFRCSLTSEEMNEQFSNSEFRKGLKTVPLSPWWPHIHFLKIGICVSSSIVATHNKNLTIHIEQMITLIHLVDSIYKQFRIFTILVFLYFWQYTDKVALTGSSSEIAQRYGLWKNLVIFNSFPHDTAALITGNKAGETGYATFPNSICNGNRAAILLWFQDNRIFYYSIILAHYVGHNLGLRHDQIYCRCIQRSHCLMEDHPPFSDSLSNCSYGQLLNLVTYWDQCLSRLPNMYDNYPYAFNWCGNKRLDFQEQCDCGSVKECLADPCCDMKCHLSAGSDCAFGTCCNNCKFSAVGVVCRHAVNNCDLPEFCNGSESSCPLDSYVQDGTPCTSNAICFKGNCTDRHIQCREMFGHDGVVNADDICYEELNVKGDRFGNCGSKPKVTYVYTYEGQQKKEVIYETVPCRKSTIFCGRLQCEGMKTLPRLDKHITFYELRVKKDKKELICFGIDYPIRAQQLDAGMVWDGSKCTENTMCLNHMCVPIAQLHFDCTPEKCNYRGVCNNKKNCHCQFGWSPPFCDLLGYGGSLDSGPAEKYEHYFTILSLFIFILIRIILFIIAFSFAFFTYVRKKKLLRKR